MQRTEVSDFGSQEDPADEEILMLHFEDWQKVFLMLEAVHYLYD